MFVSMLFPMFLGIVIVLFFSVPKGWRSGVLLLSSYVFCGYIDRRSLLVLVAISIFAWIAGLEIERSRECGKKKKSKIETIAAVAVCILILCTFKYTTYFVQRFGLEERISAGILECFLMPVGLSFYVFQAIGYLVDIYKGVSRGEKNFWDLGCYFAFFAKLVSGPIERENSFLIQMKKLHQVKLWDRGRLSVAFTYMLWGYFMKMVVADRLAVIVGKLFGSYQEFDSFWLLLGMLFYTVQIYCDFAGYSNIAIGCAKIFGIDLIQNFRAPYQASNITEFWRKWHISLSSWLRDYLYIPLGGNRKGMFRKCINTMIVFLVCGMWHGAGLNFMAWGFLHGVYSVADSLIRKGKKHIAGGKVMTFFAVAFAWLFFRADSLRAALRYIVRMITAGIHPEQYDKTIEVLRLSGAEAIVICVSILLVWVLDELCNRRQMCLPELIQLKKNTMRYFIFYLLIIAIFVFGMYGPGYHAEEFIYMSF